MTHTRAVHFVISPLPHPLFHLTFIIKLSFENTKIEWNPIRFRLNIKILFSLSCNMGPFRHRNTPAHNLFQFPPPPSIPLGGGREQGMMAFSNRPTTTPKGAKNGNKKWPESSEGGREGKEQAIEAKSVPLTHSRGKPVLRLSMLQHGMDGRAIDRGGEEEHMCGFSNVFSKQYFWGNGGE